MVTQHTASLIQAKNATNIVPTENDVVFGMVGRSVTAGTRRLREIVKESFELQRKASVGERRVLEEAIIAYVKKELPLGARFLQFDQNTKSFLLMTDHQARKALGRIFNNRHSDKKAREKKARESTHAKNLQSRDDSPPRDSAEDFLKTTNTPPAASCARDNSNNSTDQTINQIWLNTQLEPLDLQQLLNIRLNEMTEIPSVQESSLEPTSYNSRHQPFGNTDDSINEKHSTFSTADQATHKPLDFQDLLNFRWNEMTEIINAQESVLEAASHNCRRQPEMDEATNEMRSTLKRPNNNESTPMESRKKARVSWHSRRILPTGRGQGQFSSRASSSGPCHLGAQPSMEPLLAILHNCNCNQQITIQALTYEHASMSHRMVALERQVVVLQHLLQIL